MEECNVCHGSGSVACPGCETWWEQRVRFLHTETTIFRSGCARCNSTGRVTCPVCQGKEPEVEEVVAKRHSYLVIDYRHNSKIVHAESPEKAAYYHSDQGGWHIREGRADHHYIGWQFYNNGTVSDRPLDIVDLGEK